jgi:choline dehydrogenase-like flavoprotein
MACFDYDVAIIGSGFGGSVAALRAAEKGYRVGVMEAGRRWKDEDLPKTMWDQPHYAWLPAAGMYGIQRMEYLDDVLVLSGAGVGGGSHVYANTLYVPPKRFFDAAEWAGITDWADELAPCIDQARRMLGVVRYPYMPTDVDRYIQQVAFEMGRGETFNKAPVGVYFGTPGVEVEDPYFGGVGPRRTGCISCGNCMIGCGLNAKNKLTANYLYLAEKLGVVIHELHEVYELVPLEGGGFEVHTRHPGWAQRAAHLHRHTYIAEQVIVAAHAYGSAKLLLHMQHEGRLTGLSSQLGQRARTNSEQILTITRPHGQWKRGPEKIHITPGSIAITSGVWPDAVTSIEPTIYGVGSNVFAFLTTYVGAYAVQLARRVAREVIATAFSNDVAYVQTLGAHHVIDVQTSRFEEVLTEVDVVVDTVGGETQDRSFSVLKCGGVLVSAVAEPDQQKAVRHGVRALFILVDVSSERLEQLATLIEAGELTTSVGDVLPLAEARTAHEMLAGKPHKRGKIVLRIDRSL